MFKRVKDITDEEFNKMIIEHEFRINDLKYQEFMANTYTEKGIIREDIDRLKSSVHHYRSILEERQ